MFRNKKVHSSDVEEAMIRLIHTEKKQLYRIAYSYVKNEQDALDVLQDAVCKAIANQDKLMEPAFMKSWLIRILINCALDSCRKHKRTLSIDSDAFGEQKAESGFPVEEILDLKAAMDSLEETQKTLIRLRYFEDLKMDDIAHIMEMPLGTVKSQLHRTLIRLRLNLGEAEAYE